MRDRKKPSCKKQISLSEEWTWWRLWPTVIAARCTRGSRDWCETMQKSVPRNDWSTREPKVSLVPPQVDLPLNAGPGIPAGERQMDSSPSGSSFNLWMKLHLQPSRFESSCYFIWATGQKRIRILGYSILERGRGGGKDQVDWSCRLPICTLWELQL